MELVKSDRYVPQTGQGIVNEISTNTGKPLVTAEEEFAARRGLLSNLSDSVSMLSGDYDRDPRWQMAAWQKGVDPSTKLGILKGLATDIINLPKDKINPAILRSQYKALHKVPAETITENVDRLEFVPELTKGAKQSYIPGGQIKYTWGDHTYSPGPGTSSIRLNPGAAELTHPNQVSSVEYAAPWNRTAVHEVAHAMTINPDNLMKIEDPIARKYMRQLIKSSDKQPYTEKSTERISKEMESWQKSMEGAGAKITPARLKKHLTESIKREAVLQEIKEMRKITDYGKFKKELPKRIKTWTRDDPEAKGKKWYDNFFRKSETSTEDLFDYK